MKARLVIHTGTECRDVKKSSLVLTPLREPTDAENEGKVDNEADVVDCSECQRSGSVPGGIVSYWLT